MFNEQNPKKRFKNFNIKPIQIVSLSFLAVILAGTFLLMLPISSRQGMVTPFADALFTATSATCVTGLIIYDTYLYWSTFGQIVVLTLIQIGGLGLVTLTAFFNIMLGKKLGLRGMDLAKESVSTDSFANVKKMLHTVMTVTFSIEALGAFILAFTFVPKYGTKGIYISIFISISAFCNAGFDVLGSEGAFSSLTTFVTAPSVYLPVAMLVIFGGLGFIVWYELFTYRKTKKVSLHTKVVLSMTTFLLLIGTVIFTACEWNNPATMGSLSFFDKIGAGFFQSVTTRTAGFNTIDQAGMTDLSKLVSIPLMFIGASPASTGGGIKVTTIAVIIMTVASVIHGYEDTTICKRTVDKKAVYKALALFSIALLVVISCSLLIHFALDTSISPIDVVFETVSAFGTVGLSAGVTAQVGVWSRALLILCMYFGRVGPLTLIISLALRYGSNKEVLPHGRILIG